MKKFIILVLALIPAFAWAQNSTYTLTVKLSALKKPTKAYLVYNFGFTNKKVIDSATSADGAFVFNRPVGDTVKATIFLDHDGQGTEKYNRNADIFVVFLDNSNMVINSTDSIKNAVVTGSPINTEYARYSAQVLTPGDNEYRAINTTFNAASDEKKKDQNFINSLMATVKAITTERDSLKLVYVRQNPTSLFSLVALEEMSGGRAGKAGDEEADFKSLSPALQTSKEGVKFANLINSGRSTAIGAMAADFTQNDVNGKPVKLSDFKGKYVLVDFWASWCGPCRGENPNVLKAYNKYKDKNFTIVGISLDAKKDPWLAAIKADKLTWTELSDLNSWNNSVAKQYDITSIPQNFLIDPNGKIIAKNLRGDDLETELATLFK